MLNQSRKVKSRKVKSRKIKSRKVKSRKVKSRKVKSRKVKSRKVKFHMSPSKEEIDDSLLLHSDVYHFNRMKKLSDKKKSSTEIKELSDYQKQEEIEENFIFDFDNFCHNIGLIDDLALYDEIKFFVDKKELNPKAINNTIFGARGIFKNNRLIPTLVPDTNLSTKFKNVYDYGTHKIVIHPKSILGSGSYGKIIKSSFDGKQIAIKTTHERSSEDKLLNSIVRETVIQSHLSCSYSRYLEKHNDMALIPSVKMMGKILTNDSYEYYIGMEKLNESLDDYLIRNSNNSENILKAINAVWKLIGYLQNKEKFIHRDLHTGNIMYNYNNGRFYIIDFGMSCLLDKNVINNDSMYDPIPIVENKAYNRYFNKSHDLRFFLGSVLDIMGYTLPPNIGRMIAKRFAYFAFTSYNVLYSSVYSDSESDSESDDDSINETIFRNLYRQHYNLYDFRFDPYIYDNFTTDFTETTYNYTPEKIATYKAKNKLQRLVQFYL